MFLLQTPVPNPFSSPFSPIGTQPYSVQFSSISNQTLVHHRRLLSRHLPCFAVSKKSDSNPEPPESSSNTKAKPKTRTHRPKAEDSTNNNEGSGKEGEDPGTIFPTTIPRKPRRGRRSEAVAVEDFVRDQLERTFESIRQQNPGVLEGKENVFKDKVDDSVLSESSDDEADKEEDEDENNADGDVGKGKGKKKKVVVQEESQDWPLDADVGWGTRASEYFEKHPIKNIVADDGVEIDWEGEMDDNWVNEINCLDWERFAFHPSPLVVLVFERYNRATGNWKILKELEKAAKVYRNAKDRLPPRTVKLDINIERDLAYALKVKECPQILFLRGNKILYREKEFRTADELVQMIAHFYYNAKKPSCVNNANLCP